MTVQTEPQSLRFQAEATQILRLVTESLYSNKEIFVRELISNASDAIDRLRLELLTRPELAGPDEPLNIQVRLDPAAGTITVADNGVGMTRQEVIDHIGTVAKSGTHEFLQTLSGDQSRDAALIGQFGVGFYSSFIVAEKVTLVTRRVDQPAEEAVRWQSDGRGEYTLETITSPARGTTIVLQLRDGEEDLLDDDRLRSIIQRYSDHISVPILMPTEAAGDEPDGGAGQAGDGEAPADEDQDDEPRASEEQVNQASALWTRPKSELTERDYADFYQYITGDSGDPLAWLHSKVEGTYEYTMLLFIPAQAPFDLWATQPYQGIRLHVQRVFIMDDNTQLMPPYLRFLRGVIDSSDLPLNVSRELLQGSRAAEIIRSTATKKVLKLLKDMADNDPGQYATFWREFGTVLKEGVADDYGNRDDIARLLRFTSTVSAGYAQDVSLNDYVLRMKEGQEKIYYLLSPSLVTAANSPHLEAFKKKGIEVLLLGDPVDDWVVTSLQQFDGKRLQSVSQGPEDFGELQDQQEQQASDNASTEFAELLRRLKEALGDAVYAVRVTSRLTTSPACIVANEPEEAFLLSRRIGGSELPVQPVLEINPQHPLVERLRRAAPGDPQVDVWAHVLYNEAVLTLGARVEDPAAFVTQVNGLFMAMLPEDDRTGHS